MITNKRIIAIVALLLLALFYAGCIPEDSIEWSEDGSIGLLRKDDSLYLVDGQSGQLTEVSKEGVQPWPDISNDGSLIAYSQSVIFDSLEEGLQALPDGQVKLIRYTANKIKEAIIDANGLVNEEFPSPENNILANNKGWECLKVIVAPTNEPNNKTVVAINILTISRIEISPDMKNVAYLIGYPENDEGHKLFVASLEEDISAMMIAESVALGYDWRPDSRAIAYMNWDGEGGGDFPIGTLKERIIADENYKLFVEEVRTEQESYIRTHNCTGQTKDLAGVIYYPWLSVKYGVDNRLFFSTAELSLPSSKMDEGRWSLFCYDPVTGSVVDVLPSDVAVYTSSSVSMSAFEISPDGKKVLLPIKNNRFIGYELGTHSTAMPIEEDEGFGEEDVSKIAPAFKGNNAISFLVSGDSHFLAEKEDKEQIAAEEPNELEQQEQESPRDEIIILNDDGSHWILSESWPDDM
ncbi:MAG: hypothetical protein ACYTFM_00630 [Planctomycetota bacterium]|jgi:hypothetical protein